MKCVVRVQQRDEDIDIQQGAHELNTFFIHYLPDFLQRDDLARGREYRHAIAHREFNRSISGQTFFCEFGQHLSGCFAFLFGQFLRCL